MHRQRRRGLSWARLFRLNLVDKSVGSWLKLQVATKTISMAVKQTTYICQTCPYSISTGQVSKSQRATVSSRCRLTNKPASTPKMIPKMTSEQLWLLNILANQRLWLSETYLKNIKTSCPARPQTNSILATATLKIITKLWLHKRR